MTPGSGPAEAGEATSAKAAAHSGVGFAMAPGIIAGTALGVSDVLAKIVMADGVDVLTLLSLRSIVGLVFVASWLWFGEKPKADARMRLFSIASGILFAALIYCLFKAIAAIDVPTAILSYFTYPLLTGFAAAFAGLEPLRWKGVLCALAAFCGLAIMIGAHPAGLAFAGVGYALAAACCRTGVLLGTRAFLVGADARLSTWYSMLSSSVVFLAASWATQPWNMPQTGGGWTALILVSVAMPAAILCIFISTLRIGPFRTALIMNLEPLTATVVSALLLGQVITPLQGLGSFVMLAALCAFQLWR